MNWEIIAPRGYDLGEPAFLTEITSVSGDGSRAALERMDGAGLNSDIWIMDLESGQMTRSTFVATPGVINGALSSSPRVGTLKEADRPRLLAAIDAIPSPFQRSFFKLLLLTGLRKSEVLNIRHVDLDLRKRSLQLPKTKSGKPRTVPLADSAVTIIRSLPRCVGNDHLFPAHSIDRETSEVQFKEGNKRMYCPDKRWSQVRREAGCPDLTIHDIRRSATGAIIEVTGNPELAKEVLGHADLATTLKHYAVTSSGQKRRGVEALEKELQERPFAAAWRSWAPAHRQKAQLPASAA